MMYYRISKNEKNPIFWKKNHPGVGSDLKSFENSIITRYEVLKKPCRSNSDDFFGSQLIRIHTVFHIILILLTKIAWISKYSVSIQSAC